MRSCAKIVPKLHGGAKPRLSILGRSESTKPNIVRRGEEVFIFPNNWFADLRVRGASSATLAVPSCCDCGVTVNALVSHHGFLLPRSRSEMGWVQALLLHRTCVKGVRGEKILLEPLARE